MPSLTLDRLAGFRPTTALYPQPTLPALVCSCSRVSQTQPPTYRIALSKSKNPARCSVVLALGESNSKTIDANQKSRLLYDKTTQYPAGFEIRVIA